MPQQSFRATTLSLPPGTIVRVRLPLYEHVGLLGDSVLDGERTVVAFSARAGGFDELPLSQFAGGHDVVLGGYLGGLPPDVVMERARSKKGQPYSWFAFNCEHFVRFAHGVAIESPQLQQWAWAVGLLGVLTVAARAGSRNAGTAARLNRLVL